MRALRENKQPVSEFRKEIVSEFAIFCVALDKEKIELIFLHFIPSCSPNRTENAKQNLMQEKNAVR